MEEKKKNRISIWEVLLLAIFFGVGVSFVFSMYYNDKLETQLKERDVLIERLMKKDSLLNTVFELKYDSTGSYSYTTRTKNGRVVKYNELTKEIDSLMAANRNIEYDKDYKINNLSKSIDGIHESKNEIIEQYNALVNKSNEYAEELNVISKKLRLKQDSLSILKSVVRISNRVYGIVYHVTENKGNRKISIESNRIDSALVLFPYYKHKIKKIEITDSTITSVVDTENLDVNNKKRKR